MLITCHVGVAVYYLAPKWYYAVNVFVAIDSQTPVKVDLQDHASTNSDDGIEGDETVRSAPVWSATGLSNTVHKVVVTRGDMYAVVDGFM